jgi:hypothetical protein
MTAPYRKKLIEVALPLKAINDESALRNWLSEEQKHPNGPVSGQGLRVPGTLAQLVHEER